MNKKGINTILIILLLGVWGVLGYRFFKPSNNTMTTPYTYTPPQNKVYQTFAKDTFDLRSFLLEKDPFLGKISYNKPKQISVSTVRKKHTKPTPNKWPKIEYLGFVKSQNSKYPLVLLRVDKKLYRVKNKKEIKGIIVKNVFKDSILLKKGNENKAVRRKR